MDHPCAASCLWANARRNHHRSVWLQLSQRRNRSNMQLWCGAGRCNVPFEQYGQLCDTSSPVRVVACGTGGQHQRPRFQLLSCAICLCGSHSASSHLTSQRTCVRGHSCHCPRKAPRRLLRTSMHAWHLLGSSCVYIEHDGKLHDA